MTACVSSCASGMFQKNHLFRRNRTSSALIPEYSGSESSRDLVLRLLFRTSSPYSPGSDACRPLTSQASAREL